MSGARGRIVEPETWPRSNEHYLEELTVGGH